MATASVRRLSDAMGHTSSDRAAGPVASDGSAEVVALTQEVNALQAVLERDRLADSHLAAIVEPSDDAIVGKTLRRHRHQLERRSRAPLRLHRRRDGRQPDRPAGAG